MRYSNSFRLLAVVVIYCLPVYADESAGPEAVIEGFHQQLITSMKQGGDFTARYQLLAPIITVTFDITTICRIALGRHWRALPDADKTTIETAMRAMLVSTYADRFATYNDQKFSINESTSVAADRVMVKTTLETIEETVQLDYLLSETRLSETGTSWQVYDIVANGVSDLSLKRSLYSDAFTSGGLPAVLDEIRANTIGTTTGSLD